MIYAMGYILVLDRSSNPDVTRNHTAREKIGVPLEKPHSPVRTLCKHLIDMSINAEHHLKNPANEILWNIDMKQIRH